MPLIDPLAAEIVVVPAASAVASPDVFTVATAAFDDPQVTEFVRFCWVPFVNVPVAANCWVVPAGIDAPCGVTASDTSAGAVTVSVLEPTIVPIVAVILVVPWLTLVANPALILATDGAEEVHFTELVRFFVVPLL